MKKILALSAMIMASFTFAQTGAKVNSQEILELMPEYAQAEKDIQKRQIELQERLLRLQEKIQKIQVELDSLTQVSAPQYIIEEKQIDFQAEYSKFNKLQQEAQQIIQNTSMALMEPIQEKFKAAVKIVCETKGIDFVMDVSQFIYSSDKLMDITEEVIKELGLSTAPGAGTSGTPAAGGQ